MENTVTREQFITELKGAIALTPSNTAIQKHLAKVEAMNDEQWVEHRTNLIRLGGLAKPSITRMVAEAVKDSNDSIVKAIEAAKKMCLAEGFHPDESGDIITYTSRDGGNGTDCEPDPDTLRAASSLVKKIRALGLEASRTTCDEWVSVNFGKPGSGAKDAL